MYCKILTDVTKASPHKSTNQNALQVLSRTHNQFADVLQVPSRRHEDNRRYSTRSQQTSQRQSPMYCKNFIEVTKTSPHKSTNQNALQVFSRTHNQFADVLQVPSRRHKDNRRCIARSLQTSQRQSPMYCKIFIEFIKTIADVMQDLYRSHKDSRHKSTDENVVPAS